MMVASRSFQLAMVRVAMMPGMAQAKLDSSGMKARPDRPTLPISVVEQESSARQVARVFQHQDEEEQDQDLRQEHDHAALRRRSRRRPAGCAAGRRSCVRWSKRPRPSMPSLIASIGTLAHENTAWKIRNSTTASITRPHTGCMTTASMPWLKALHRRGTRSRPWRGCAAPPFAARSTDALPARRPTVGAQRAGQVLAEPGLQQGEQPGMAVVRAPRRSRRPGSRARPRASSRR